MSCFRTEGSHDHMASIIKYTFKYLNLLRENGDGDDGSKGARCIYF